MKPALPLLLLLAACATSPTAGTPRDRCEAQAVEDPTVQQMQAIAAGSQSWLWQNEDKIKIAHDQAVARCLQGQGGPGTIRRGGGVERPR